MTQSVVKDVRPYTAQRVMLTSPQSLKATLDALQDELNEKKSGLALFKLLATAKSKEELDRGIGAMTEGKRDFMYVLVYLLKCFLPEC